MRNHPIACGLLWLFLLVPVAQAYVHGPHLPDVMASRFGLSGEPGGWMAKSTFIAAHLAGVWGTALLFLVVIGWIGRAPDARFSLPSKPYWLSPKRRAETVSDFQGYMFALLFAALVFWGALSEAVYLANLDEEPRLGNERLFAMAAFLGFMVLWIAALRRRFYHVPIHEWDDDERGDERSEGKRPIRDRRHGKPASEACPQDKPLQDNPPHDKPLHDGGSVSAESSDAVSAKDESAKPEVPPVEPAKPEAPPVASEQAKAGKGEPANDERSRDGGPSGEQPDGERS